MDWLTTPSSSSSCSPSEDLQSPSVNSSLMNKKEQKRRPKPRDGTVLKCGVCGDRALGYNFDAITCESCKAFFRRNASKNKTFNCSFEGDCKLDAHTRKFCSGCRLKKCFSIGMKKDWILNENQLAKRRQKLRLSGQPEQPEQQEQQQQQQQQQQFKTDDSPEACEVTSNYTSDEVCSSSESPEGGAVCKRDIPDDDYLKPLAPEIMQQLQNMEKTYSSIFDAPYDCSISAKLTASVDTSNDLFNLTDTFIRRLIKFGKILPEFRGLPQEDQIHILKGSIMEIFVLRSAMSFDKNAEKWKFSDTSGKKELDPKVIASALSVNMYSSHIQFVKSLHELIKSDRYVLLLLFIIQLFSPDRPHVKNKEIIAKTQEKYSGWMLSYLESIYPVSAARVLYPKILMKLTDVRDLGEESAKFASHLDVTKLEPLGAEIFDLNH